jgi:hypothetical protein
MSPIVTEPPGMTVRALRPLVGSPVIVRTGSGLWRGTLVSCVRDSAWFVVEGDDVVVRLHHLVSVRPA